MFELSFREGKKNGGTGSYVEGNYLKNKDKIKTEKSPFTHTTNDCNNTKEEKEEDGRRRERKGKEEEEEEQENEMCVV